MVSPAIEEHTCRLPTLPQSHKSLENGARFLGTARHPWVLRSSTQHFPNAGTPRREHRAADRMQEDAFGLAHEGYRYTYLRNIFSFTGLVIWMKRSSPLPPHHDLLAILTASISSNGIRRYRQPWRPSSSSTSHPFRNSRLARERSPWRSFVWVSRGRGRCVSSADPHFTLQEPDEDQKRLSDDSDMGGPAKIGPHQLPLCGDGPQPGAQRRLSQVASGHRGQVL